MDGIDIDDSHKAAPDFGRAYRHVLLILTLMAAGCFLAWFSWQGTVVGIVSDDAVYLLMADSYSPYSAAWREGASFIGQFSVFPPLYPAVLAILGAGASNVLYAHIVNSAIAIGAVALAVRYFSLADLPKEIAIAIGILFFLLPFTLLQHIELLSEPLYLAITMIALTKYEASDGRGNLRETCEIAVLVSLAALTRISGIALILAFLVWQATAPRSARSFAAILIATLPCLAWEAFVYLTYRGEWNYGNLLSGAYVNLSPYALLDRLMLDARGLWHGWQSYFDLGRETYSLPAVILLLLCAAPAFLSRLAQKRLDALYLFFYLIMILLWPFQNHGPRFLYPVVPVLFFFAIASIASYCERRWRKYAATALFGLVFLAAAPSTAQMMSKAFSGSAEASGDYARTRLLYGRQYSRKEFDRQASIMTLATAAIRASSITIPKATCVYAVQVEWYMFYARRLARPLTERALQRLNANEPAECPFMYVNWLNTSASVAPGFPAEILTRPHQVERQYRAAQPTEDDVPGPLIAELLRLDGVK